jgi:hypothetical protein
MDAQRLRNLTTGILHTEIGYVYEDLEALIGETGLMTHMLPRVMRACEPWLREHLTEPRFWDGQFDLAHVGMIEFPIPSAFDREAMLERYSAQQNPLLGKDVVVVSV